MTQPADKHREAAREFVENHSARLGADGICADKATFISFLATALTNLDVMQDYYASIIEAELG